MNSIFKTIFPWCPGGESFKGSPHSHKPSHFDHCPKRELRDFRQKSSSLSPPALRLKVTAYSVVGESIVSQVLILGKKTASETIFDWSPLSESHPCVNSKRPGQGIECDGKMRLNGYSGILVRFNSFWELTNRGSGLLFEAAD